MEVCLLNRNPTHFLALLCSFFLWATPVFSAPELITAGPSWSGFTERNGEGLYHEIINEIYASRYQIRHLYVSSIQGNNLVAAGRADIKLCDTVVELPLRLSSTPMYENDYFALFRRDHNDKWNGQESLRNARLVWREGYYSQADFSIPVTAQTVSSGAAAMMLIKLGRADYYIDDLKLIKQSFRDASEGFDLKLYALKKVGSRKYYPVFSSSDKGNRMRLEYERGMEQLIKSGKLRSIYRRWDFPYPTDFQALESKGAE